MTEKTKDKRQKTKDKRQKTKVCERGETLNFLDADKQPKR
jgi:hypothetical protein